MRLKLLLTFTILTTTFLVTAQLPRNIEAKIPKGYTVRMTANGNLNDDLYLDYILILKPDDEELYFQDEVIRTRMLWILCGRKNHTWIIVKQNTMATYHFGFDANFPDCLVDIVIGKETFTIGHYGGFQNRWARSTRFEYHRMRKDWLLTADTVTITDASEADSVLSKRQYEHNAGVGVDAFNIYTD